MNDAVTGPPCGGGDTSSTMRRSGFSFIELVIVLAISGIVAAIAVPRMGNASARYRADFAARQIVMDIAQARENARVTGATQTITFNTANHTYTVTGPAAGTTRGYTVNLSAEPHNAKFVVTGTPAAAAASFSRFGECTAGLTLKIRVGSNIRTITLDDATAKARWQ